MVTVISLGGSLIAPDDVDAAYLKTFSALIKRFLDSDSERRFILVTGGGAPARKWQNAYKAVCGDSADEPHSDCIGIAATRLNAELVRAIFVEYCPLPVVIDPTAVDVFAGRVMVAAGWKPGFSSDNDAVLLAERFTAPLVVNLSNIEKVYSADPRKDSSAKPLDVLTWDEFLKITGSEWVPGKNVPFDPVASLRAKKAGIKVIVAGGKDIANIEKILSGEKFTGTVIAG
jgi:uridylate kinase